MKTRRIIRIEENTDFELILEANRIVSEYVRHHPKEKATCTVPLSNGTYYTATATPVA